MMIEQERRRQEQAIILTEQLKAERQMAEYQIIRARQMVAASAASSSSHPVAAAAAAAAPQQFSIASPPSGSGSAPQLLIGTRDVVFTPTADAPFASQLRVQSPTDVGMSPGGQVKRQSSEVGVVAQGSAKAKARNDVPSSAGEESPRSGTKRGISLPPKMKHRENEAAAKKLILDQSLRVDRPYLNTLNVPVLRAVLQQEHVRTFLSSKGKVNTSTATKPELIDEIIRHFEQADKLSERISALQATGSSSSAAAAAAPATRGRSRSPMAAAVEAEAKTEKKEQKEKKEKKGKE